MKYLIQTWKLCQRFEDENGHRRHNRDYTGLLLIPII